MTKCTSSDTLTNEQELVFSINFNLSGNCAALNWRLQNGSGSRGSGISKIYKVSKMVRFSNFGGTRMMKNRTVRGCLL